MAKELQMLDSVLDAPSPSAAVVGGAKASTKLPLFESLVNKVDHIFVGGAMAFTFAHALGMPTGRSLVEVRAPGPHPHRRPQSLTPRFA